MKAFFLRAKNNYGKELRLVGFPNYISKTQTISHYICTVWQFALIIILELLTSGKEIS